MEPGKFTHHMSVYMIVDRQIKMPVLVINFINKKVQRDDNLHKYTKSTVVLFQKFNKENPYSQYQL